LRTNKKFATLGVKITIPLLICSQTHVTTKQCGALCLALGDRNFTFCATVSTQC
jgi:hypothetical protein